MSSTSKKHNDFMSEPIGKKDVTKIPGIGSVIGENMGRKGITYAFEVFGMFLVLKQDEEKFCGWLMEFAANSKQRSDCYNAMRGWSDNYL